MDSEGAGFIGSGRNHSPLFGVPTHDNGLSPQGGIVPLLDGGIKGIHVDVQDLAHAPGLSFRMGLSRPEWEKG
jgi:hypothetical protein